MAAEFEVEVDVFSGRPNPRFTVSGDGARELTKRLATLPAARSEAAPRDTLGYRGLRVHARDPGGRTATHDAAVLSAGLVVVPDPRTGARRLLRDDDRALEQWLFAIGSATLDAVVRAVVERDLADG